MMPIRTACTVLFALSITLSGCDSGRKLYPVVGTVTFPDGQVLKGGSIEFRSAEPATRGLNASGTIAQDGTFRLKTRFPDGEKDGAVAGKHQVIVVPPLDTRGSVSGQEDVPPLLHPDMGNYDRSNLTFEVQPGNNSFPVTVRKP